MPRGRRWTTGVVSVSRTTKTAEGLSAPDGLDDQDTYAAPVATCDVVMKGGITSGIVYPWTVCELATRYRLVNVGGTSAGAIAAAAAAAAEYGRSSEGGGFVALARLPGELGATTRNGLSRLFSLFQPQAATAPLFALMTTSMSGGGGGSRIGTAVRGLRAAVGVPGGWWRLALGALPGLILLVAVGGSGLPALWSLLALAVAAALARISWTLVRGRRRVAISGALAAAALVVVVAVSNTPSEVAVALVGWLVLAVGLAAGTAWVLGRTLLREVPGNFYGLCTGMDGTGAAGLTALTPWLTELLDKTAGLDDRTEPLTFGHLWAGPGAERVAASPRPRRPAINLEVMTTCVTRGRPYRIPFETSGLYFDAAEMRRLFPEEVVAWMEQHPAPPTGGRVERLRRRVTDALVAPLLPLPAPSDLPVVVAARMSLSFPVLISAVPLHAVDRVTNAASLDRIAVAVRDAAAESSEDLDDEVAAEALQRLRGEGVALGADRLWFSDGGISSNFPIHFFDSFAPRRPTFGINLRPHHPSFPPAPGDETSSVYLPDDNASGRSQAPNLFESEGRTLVGFLKAILDTMQNWNDLMQLPLPGFRDRIAHVGLSAEEGGMNLTMPPERIAALATRGRCAGEALRVRFSTVQETGWTGWENHRWIRLRSNLSLLEAAADQLHASLGQSGQHPDGARHLRDLLDLGIGGAPSYQWSNEGQRQRALAAVEQILSVATDGVPDTQLLSGDSPRPQPTLRIVPRE